MISRIVSYFSCGCWQKEDPVITDARIRLAPVQEEDEDDLSDSADFNALNRALEEEDPERALDAFIQQGDELQLKK